MCLRVFFFLVATAVAVPETFANGLGENPPWGFANPNERIVKARNLELMKLEDAGAYDRKTNGNGNGNGYGYGYGINNVVYGDQVNCLVVAKAHGNEAQNTLEGITGTLGPSDSQILAATTGETTTSTGSGEFNTDQTSSGAHSSGADGNAISANVGTFNGGGVTDQALDNTQTNTDSPVTATANESVACQEILN